MKRKAMMLLAGLFTLAVLTLAAPFAVMELGSPGMATASRALVHAAVGYSGGTPEKGLLPLRVTSGYRVEVYAEGLGNPRFMAVTSAGDLLVSRPRSGEVLLLGRDGNNDGRADSERILLRGLKRPQGLALRDGWLYVAESDGIGKIALDVERGEIKGDYTRILDGLGDRGNHWSKTIGFGPDGWLYLSSGSTCNVCEETDPQRATMMRLQADGSELEIVATGLRNSVGFDWAPWSDALYATDNGRDLLGDNFPPCELNRIEKGSFYGWPYFNATTPDPDFGHRLPEKMPANRPPVHEFRAHNAPLGIRFLQHQDNDEKMALVALHGSWNRSEPDGYKVVALRWLDDGDIVEDDFLVGFLQGSDLHGRPVDVVEAADGRIFVSDDYAGRIYLIRSGQGDDQRAAVASRKLPSAGEALAAYSPDQRQALLEQGEQLYQSKACDSCHALPTIRHLESVSARYNLAELADFFLAPTPPMPRFELDAGQREALAVYLYSRAK